MVFQKNISSRQQIFWIFKPQFLRLMVQSYSPNHMTLSIFEHIYSQLTRLDESRGNHMGCSLFFIPTNGPTRVELALLFWGGLLAFFFSLSVEWHSLGTFSLVFSRSSLSTYTCPFEFTSLLRCPHFPTHVFLRVHLQDCIFLVNGNHLKNESHNIERSWPTIDELNLTKLEFQFLGSTKC